MNELQVLRRLDFDWVVRSSSVWKDPQVDIDAIHADARTELDLSLDLLQEREGPECPLGMVLVGRGGSGKTHLLQWLRQRTFQRNMTFLFADMTGVRDFWETMQLQVIAAIDQQLPDGYRQCQHVLAGLLNSVVQKPRERPLVWADKLAKLPVDRMVDNTQKLIAHLSRRHRIQMTKHQDVFRALIMLVSDDLDLNNAANAWLHGTETDEELLRRFAFTSKERAPIEIVQGVSWFLSLRGPTVLAIDQMDNLVAQQRFRFENAGEQADAILQDDDEARRLKAITQSVAGGLAGLVQTVMHRTLGVVSCYSETWEYFKSEPIRSESERFQEPINLSDIRTGQAARHLVEKRLAIVAERLNFTPPSPGWLFAPEAFEGTSGMSPREVLQKCEQHRRECLKEGRVKPLTSFGTRKVEEKVKKEGDAEPREPVSSRLDQEFASLKQSVEIGPCMDKDADDRVWPDLLESAFAGLVHEYAVPPEVDMVVDGSLAGGKTYRYLHARFRIIDHQRQGQEQQFCFRVILHDNAIAFQNRLKAASGDAGVDKRLAFRSLTIIRNNDPPGGPKTQQLVSQFKQLGGRWSPISDREIRTLGAIRQLIESHGPEAYDWIRQRRPVSEIGFIQTSGLLDAIEAVGKRHEDDGDDERIPIPKSDEPVGGGHAGTDPPIPKSDRKPPLPPPTPPHVRGGLCFGVREKAGGAMGSPVVVPWANLTRHTLVIAGSGSGKTNLLKRIVEEAAIAGVPSIVVDCNNDLIGLGEKRPRQAFPEEWTDHDRAKERRYTEARQVIAWTPNRQSGNPIALRLVPNFKLLADDPDELAVVVNVICNNLERVAAPGNSAKSQKMKGVLSLVVKYFAEHGGDSIEQLIEMLRELPSDIHTGIAGEIKLAGEMADLLQAKLNSTPLWNAEGTPLDPATLLGLDSARTQTRISILSMIGLPERDMQQSFLNQLAIELFTWIKRNPAPHGTLRGLLVIDEAKEFVPSGQSSVCKGPLIRLAEQARKYGLGVVFATQAPKDIDHHILNNCFTQLFGQVNSPAAVQAVKDLLTQKHASDAGSIARLNKGQFFFHNGEVENRAFRIRTSQCLSHHASPMTEEQVLERARMGSERT